MKRLLLATSALVALPAGAGAQFVDITGWYAVNGTQTCLSTAYNFNAADQPNGSSDSFSLATTGTYHFKADGTYEASTTSLSITNPEPGVVIPNATVTTRTNGGTYTIGADGETVTIPAGGSFVATVTSGPRVGQTDTLTNLSGLTRYIGDGAKEILFTNVVPSVRIEAF